MTAKPALPDRFMVDRIGTPDPPVAEYYVLDPVHDRHARVALGRLAKEYQQYGQMTAAREVLDLLERTRTAHGKVIQDLYEAKNKKTAAAASRGRRR